MRSRQPSTGPPVQTAILCWTTRTRVCYNSDMLVAASVLERVIQSRQDRLSPEVARFILSLSFAPEDERRCQELSSKAHDGALAEDEKAELDDLLTANDLLIILKSKARTAIGQSSSSAA